MKAPSKLQAIVLFTLAGMASFISGLAAEEPGGGSTVYKGGLRSACFIFNPTEKASGSGSLIDLQKKYVITNNHVVGAAEFVIVQFPMKDAKGKLIADKEKYKENIIANRGLRGKVIAKEETRDLAIIQLVDKVPDGILPVKLASGSPDVGDQIHSIGNPGASDACFVYTSGQVRQVYEKKWTAGGGRGEFSNHKATIIEATSPVSPGDSGGPALNAKGEQIGVTQGGLAGPGVSNYSFFIDVTEVKNFLKDKKIVLSPVKDSPRTDPVEVVSDPKTDPTPEPKVTPKTDPKPDPKTDVVKEPKKKDPPKVDAAVAELEAMEKKAALELGLLRPLARDPNRREVAIEKLKALIKKYPKTDTAKEADKLLQNLEK